MSELTPLERAGETAKRDALLVELLRASGITEEDALNAQQACTAYGHPGTNRIVYAMRAIEAWAAGELSLHKAMRLQLASAAEKFKAMDNISYWGTTPPQQHCYHLNLAVPPPTLKIKPLREGVTIPRYQTDGASGLDLHWCPSAVCLESARDLWRGDGYRLLGWGWETGLAIEIPEGYEGQIRPRSGTGKKGSVEFFGTIDADYRGEIICAFDQAWWADGAHVKPGDRIAQLVIAPVARCRVEVVTELSDTARGTGGFGSTGR